jgi:HD-like signal output (HDOD) protein
VELQSLAIKIARSDNLPVLSQVASALLRLVDEPNSSAKLLAQSIEQDPAISAKLLRVANSAYYGHQNVSSISTAVQLLGMTSIRAMVVGIAYQQVSCGQTVSSSFSNLDFWEHSLAVAIASRLIAKSKLPEQMEELYLAGLIHDVGMLVLDRFLPHKFDLAIQTAFSRGITLHQAETEVLGYAHDEVGGLLAEKWSLSERLITMIRYHHSPTGAGDLTLHCQIIAAGDAIARLSGYPNNSPDGLIHAYIPALSALQLTAEEIEPIRADVIAEVKRAQEIFHIRAAA